MKKAILATVALCVLTCTGVHAGGTRGGTKTPPVQESDLSIMEQIEVFLGFEV